MKRFLACAALCAAVFGAGAAQADEIRFGVVAHDALGLDAGIQGKEESLGLSLGYVSDRFHSSGWIPRLEIGGNLNLGGKTSFLYAGGLWRGYFGGDRFYIEGSLGLAVHDGKKEIPDLVVGLTAAEAQRRIFENAHYIEYGSDVLFREALTLGYQFTEALAADIYIEHFSHGKILASGSNEGADAVGLRFSYQLN